MVATHRYCLFGLLFTVPVNSYGHVRQSIDLATNISWTSSDEAVDQYSVHIISFLTDEFKVSMQYTCLQLLFCC